MTLKSGLRRFDLQIFGGGGGGTSSTQYRKRDPEEPELTRLRHGMYGKIFPTLEAYDPADWTRAKDTANSALASQQDMLGRAVAAGDQGNSLLGKLTGLLETGQVPQAMEDAAKGSINRGLKSGMEGMLSGLGNRGVLNSSVTNAGIGGLSTKAANAFQDSYLNNFNSLLSGYQGALSGAANNANTLLNAAQGYGNMGGQAFSNAGAALMPAYNFWCDAQSSYDNREDFDTVVSQGGGK